MLDQQIVLQTDAPWWETYILSPHTVSYLLIPLGVFVGIQYYKKARRAQGQRKLWLGEVWAIATAATFPLCFLLWWGLEEVPLKQALTHAALSAAGYLLTTTVVFELCARYFPSHHGTLSVKDRRDTSDVEHGDDTTWYSGPNRRD